MKTPLKNKLKTFFSVCFIAISGITFAGDLPDTRLTPGVINPDITQDNIQKTVCVKGFSKTIRPPVYYTNSLKKYQIRQYGYANTDPRDYEEDHLIALSIGGAPMDEKNLWPQPRKSEWGADKKDELEFTLFLMVCKNEILLKDAQRAMATDWIAAWKSYVPSHPSYKFGKTD